MVNTFKDEYIVFIQIQKSFDFNIINILLHFWSLWSLCQIIGTGAESPSANFECRIKFKAIFYAKYVIVV